MTIQRHGVDREIASSRVFRPVLRPDYDRVTSIRFFVTTQGRDLIWNTIQHRCYRSMGQASRDHTDSRTFQPTLNFLGRLRSRKVQIMDRNVCEQITNGTANKTGLRQDAPDPIQTFPVWQSSQQTGAMCHAGRERGKKQS